MNRLPGLLLAIGGVGFMLAAVLAAEGTAGRAAFIAAGVVMIVAAFMVGRRRGA